MKAVLVFCECRHDVVFAQRSLGAHGGCEWVDKHIGALPSPFGPRGVATKGLIARRFEEHALENLTLQAAAHPPLPCFESIVENTETDTIFFMVRVHGQDRSEPRAPKGADARALRRTACRAKSPFEIHRRDVVRLVTGNDRGSLWAAGRGRITALQGREQPGAVPPRRR